jgi:hypothetical protein
VKKSEEGRLERRDEKKGSEQLIFGTTMSSKREKCVDSGEELVGLEEKAALTGLT